jgi:hypothetical protein
VCVFCRTCNRFLAYRVGYLTMTTKAEKDYMDNVASLGCLICQSPAALHHPTSGMGRGQRASHWLVVPLCPEHHQGDSGIHAGAQTFFMRNGYMFAHPSEMGMVAKVIELLWRRRFDGI